MAAAIKNQLKHTNFTVSRVQRRSPMDLTENYARYTKELTLLEVLGETILTQ